MDRPSVSDQLSVTLAPTTSSATMMKKANLSAMNRATTSTMPRMAAMYWRLMLYCSAMCGGNRAKMAARATRPNSAYSRIFLA